MLGYVHLSVAIPPKESISGFMGYLKGKSTLMITTDIQNCKVNEIKLLGREDIYVETIGNNTEEAVQKVYERASRRSRKRRFRVVPLYIGCQQ